MPFGLTTKLRMRKIVRLFVALALLGGVAACNPETYKNINYLQDISGDAPTGKAVNKGIIIQPQDQLSIVVNSADPKLSFQFNKSIASYFAGSEFGGGGGQYISGYVVDNDGYIIFPALGKLYVSGMSRWELQDLIADKLSEKGLLRDAVVTVEYLNFKISVLGEVTNPGTYAVSGDKITLLQALALAHDLTIYGRRDNVMVIREQGGKRNTYEVNLTRSDMFDSPAYYLQQNDVIYVTPNEVRAGQSTINENYFKSGSFWISLGSIAITVANLIITMTR
jgi:polysaccharide export outer membrane protein